MEIRSLGNTSFNELFRAFEQAFIDYEIQLNKAQLQSMLKRRGFNADLSFAAFDAGKIVALTCNGTGSFENISTAYDTGTGTLIDYRRKGLATKVFGYSLPYFREQGIKQYLLEVLEYNAKAISVYRNVGFEVSREFYYFFQNNKEVWNEAKVPNISCKIEPINIGQHTQMSTFWDFHPSWQNSLESIRRASGDFVVLGVFAEKKLVGYCAFEPASGDIAQIAVAKGYRRKGFGSLLLQKMLELNNHDTIKVTNTDIKCNSIKGFLEAKNIVMRGKQFEMIKAI
jgi:ribosomal protein S18 acetylase RimI-like enzyme